MPARRCSSWLSGERPLARRSEVDEFCPHAALVTGDLQLSIRGCQPSGVAGRYPRSVLSTA